MTVRYQNNFVKVHRWTAFLGFCGFFNTYHGVSAQTGVQNGSNRSLSWKIKEHEAISASIFFTLVAICFKLNDELMCLTASPNWNVKQRGECMQEGQRKIEATGSSLFHFTLRNKMGSDCTSWYTDGLIHSVSAGSPTLSQFEDSDTQIQTHYFCITEAYHVLIHWLVVYAILIFCWSTACFITLLSFTQNFYIAELYPILTHC